jgi:hypothetical protein
LSCSRTSARSLLVDWSRPCAQCDAELDLFELRPVAAGGVAPGARVCAALRHSKLSLAALEQLLGEHAALQQARFCTPSPGAAGL